MAEATTNKPVIIETVNGAQYEIANAELAKRVHPGCKVLRYADGNVYEELAQAEATTTTTTTAAPVTPQPETSAPTTTEAAG